MQLSHNYVQSKSCSHLQYYRTPYIFWPVVFSMSIFKELNNRFQEINSASICSLAGWYDNPIFSVPSPHRLFQNSPALIFILWTLKMVLVNRLGQQPKREF
jgi:hypothetical protein